MLVRPAVAAFDLVPGPDLSPVAEGPPNTWHAHGHVVRFTTDAPLPAGWYRLRLALTNAGRPAIRKRAELFADGEKLEAFEWNHDLREDLIVRLPRPVHRLELTLRHVGGPFTLTRFELRRTSKARTVARAVRLKLKLLQSYNCFWPVVSRGGKLLAQGRLREFGRKVLRGLPDSRTMRIEVKRAAEVSAMWWRRRALSADEIAKLKHEADAIATPTPVAVLIPADLTRADHARQAILSVLRQVYPHWELAVAWPTDAVSQKLLSLTAWDSRIRIVRPGGDGGLSQAVSRALESLESDRVLVLPPDWELAEAALLRFAQADADCVTCPVPGGGTAALLPRAFLQNAMEKLNATTAVGVTRWAASLIPETSTACLNEPQLFPLDTGEAVAAKRPARPATRSLVLAGSIRGISGWDYVVFAMLKGLRSAGVDVQQHHAAGVFPDLLPPDLRPKKVKRTTQPQLAIAPPFLLKSFAPDDRTAAYTMWESDRLDAAEVAVLNRSRVVIVPSRWGAECFRVSGVTVPIEVVPLGYDPLVFHPSRPSDSLCIFGTAGALSAGGLRKNVRRVVDLFRAAFPTEADVRLRVKITPNCPPFEIDDDPRIEIVRAALPYSDLARWNRSLTAYVNASFAEGFGFHLLEAMACGVPLITANYSGLTEFFDESVGYAVPHKLVEANNDIYRGRWADPDDAAIVEQMRRVYRDRAEAATFGEAAASRARTFTWRDTGRKLLKVLDQYDLLEPTR
ncbi:glycosyltransferase [Limnoglobus roseus]|uniref:GT4 family glycosyltransferase n=1 Tax=Limnoglobus roseus TaxID=2598579 RepID=A0A5C1AAS1_9BACT|nr:glycosyltransferase [Limnoglobus roseus]QEL15317.1 GT4 family glycosyltransferase [Limnoglobus roseus]